ncbi:hypothetical protein ACFYYS_11505 [Streptomyces sp. NPDC002120]|uniref:hypothetical protein n=1 Tax=Streptomyces sp. NPDC002120 TaxID=3364631 RepID=UPI0036A1A945
MAVQHGLQVLAAVAAAAVTTGVLMGRWWRTRTRGHSGPGAEAARGVGLPAGLLDLTGDQALRTADAHLERYWASIAPLYPRSDTGRPQS